MDSVVVNWSGLVLMIGPFGDWIKLSYDTPIIMISEIDGVRILTEDTYEFLERVPDAVEDVFRIGSTKPAALLYDAYEHFQKKNPRSDEIIRNIKPLLEEAADMCIQAAGYEHSISNQKMLLKVS